MRIIGLRHGQSSYNLQKLCNDDPHKPVNLTSLGKKQAAQAAKALRTQQLVKIYSSPLPRAMQTAEIVNKTLRLPLEPHPA